jgi:hypothetical protein
MTDVTMDDFLKDNHDAILAAVQARMHGDETMSKVAAQRELSENDLTGQVLAFTLQAIRSDLTLGSTAAMTQGMSWLNSLRAGHELALDGRAVARLMDAISDEVDARLDSEALRAEYSAYRAEVGQLIIDAFPATPGGPA